MSEISLSSVNFEQRINQIYDHLYASASVKTPTAIANEVSKILHSLAYLEKKDNNSESFRLHTKLQQKLDSEANSIIANKIRSAFKNVQLKWGIYESDDTIKLSDFDIAYVYKKLSGVLISDPDKDIFGDAMEVFRSHWAKSHGGQFFTDQRVTKLAMTLLEFNPLNGDDLVDICTGTGGFLLAGVNHIRSLLIHDKSNNVEVKIADLVKKSLIGQEIDEDVASIANTTLSSRIGEKGLRLVNQGDSIIPNAFDRENTPIRFNSHLCAATNPPFGTKITIKDPSVLVAYELAHSRSSRGEQVSFFNLDKIVPRAPDILFLEQNIKLLKPGEGRLAIVTPFQIVSGPQTLFVRRWLLKRAQILAVIDLPPETFQPYTGTKTSLLILKRREKPLEDIDLSQDPDIFMSIPKWIGHDRRGNLTYKRSIDGTISDEILSDFPEVEEAFLSYKSGENPNTVHKESFTIPATNILLDSNLRIDAHFLRSHIKTKSSLHNGINKNTSEWKIVKIKDVVKRIFYPGRFTRHYVEDEENSVPFLGGTNITQLILNTEKRLSINNPKLDELKVESGWILVTRSGSTGIVSSVPPAWNGYAISEHVIRIIPDNEKVPSEYLYAFLKSKYGQHLLNQGVYGSVIDEITPEFIGHIEIPISKSKRILGDISRSIENGEKHREEAIESFNNGVEKIEKLFFG